MNRSFLFLISGAVLLGCAVFDYAWRTTLLTGLMLLLPFLDRTWEYPDFFINKKRLIINSGLIVCLIALTKFEPQNIYLAISTLLLIALPEEWFFRAYFMQRLKNIITTEKRFILSPTQSANTLTSVLFTLLHLPTQGVWGLSVFIPSLFFGWFYQKYNDFISLVLIHAVFNLIFLQFINPQFFDLII